MNTYQVTWYPPSAPAPSSSTVTAAEFIVNEEYVLFLDASNLPVFAVHRGLMPVVDRTATG